MIRSAFSELSVSFKLSLSNCQKAVQLYSSLINIEPLTICTLLSTVIKQTKLPAHQKRVNNNSLSFNSEQPSSQLVTNVCSACALYTFGHGIFESRLEWQW